MTAPVFVVDPDALATAAPGGFVRVDGPEGRHAVTVRRLAAGERVELVDARGRRVAGTVEEVDGGSALTVHVDAVDDEPEPAPRMVVVQALPKGERGELAVELLTEVGVDEIVPWSATNCVSVWRGDRVDKSRRRWSDAARAAAKQARRARFPAISSLASTPDVVERLGAASLALVLHEAASAPLATVDLPDAGEVVIVVGPEGGLTAVELTAFRSAGATAVRLGPTVLRTSSAGIAAVAALLARSSRWAGSPPGSA